MTLLDFINAQNGPVLGFFVGVGCPAGREEVLNDPDFDCSISPEEMEIMEGAVANGIWDWDGYGPSLADERANAICRVQAWLGSEAEAERILS